jgi:23S rRNA (cytosine1962-C5)-methyltransferase
VPGASLKVIRGECELSEKDVVEIPKGLLPGEWILLLDKNSSRKYIAHINPYSESYFKIKIVRNIPIEWKSDSKETEIAVDFLRQNITIAFQKRLMFKDYNKGCRLIYGSSDGLTGLIVDVYLKYIFIQINVAGIDRFRNEVSSCIQSLYPGHVVRFFDNIQYRKQEVLPIYDVEPMADNLDVSENEIMYQVSKRTLQKIGYYYDHRENRRKLLDTLGKISINKGVGLDLFSYVGSWGLHMLKGGVGHVDFVDQGDLSIDIENNLDRNGYKGQGSFYRSDVFKFLDDAFEKKKFYNIIVSDPPAFTKSEKNKSTAIGGYEKLHQKALRLISNEGLFIAASCTHYVSHEELDKTVQVSANKNNQILQLLDIGVQGYDHPAKGFTDKGFYIKYLLYIVKKS